MEMKQSHVEESMRRCRVIILYSCTGRLSPKKPSHIRRLVACWKGDLEMAWKRDLFKHVTKMDSRDRVDGFVVFVLSARFGLPT